MSTQEIILPSKPRVVSEEGNKGVYEIDNLYPGYGHTLGNSLRRIILSSLPGAAITTLKIDGVAHEFSTIQGVHEDVMTILLNLKRVRFNMTTDEPQLITLSVKGAKKVNAGDIKVGGQIEILNPDQHVVELNDKNASLDIEMTIERGLGFVPKEVHQKGKMDIGAIAIDAIFSPIRRVAYEVENMRVGDKTNHNRLRIIIETDGTVSPREALESSIKIMIDQLKAIVNIPNIEIEAPSSEGEDEIVDESDDKKKEDLTDVMKTRIDTLELSTRTLNALTGAGIRTVGGIARKKKEDLLEIEGMGEKGILEIRKALSGLGITLK